MKDKNIKRKILKDRVFPDSDQINKHQDFDQVHKDYSLIKKMIMKKILLGSIAVVAAAGTLAFVVLNKGNGGTPESKVESLEAPKTVACIQPPVPGAETPFVTYRISTKNGGQIHYPTGSSITIPANAFFSKNGSPLSDSVEVRYREFHDPLAIFLSGIPMHYDSAGVTNTLESAGMIEIRAFDRGESLTLREQSPIQVRMASATNDARFNLYELDTIHNNWVYKGKDKIESPVEYRSVQTTRKAEKIESKAGNTVKPQMSDPQRFNFKITYDRNTFPELAAYENVLFEVTDDDFKPAYFKINWNKIMLYNDDEQGQYIVKLKKADTTISVRARPVFDKEHYPQAQAEFEARHTMSGRERDQKAFEKQAVLNEVNKQLATYNINGIIATANRMALPQSYRVFAVLSLGIHNCDFPIPPIMAYAFSFKKEAIARKRDEVASRRAYSTIFLIEKGKNTVFRFSKGEPVRCDPKARNLMWTVTERNEIAFFRIADYSRLSNGGVNPITPVVATSQELAFNEIRKFSE